LLLAVQEAAGRSRTMFHMANCMRILSDQYGVVFVVTNQVTADFDPRSNGNGNALRPALGLSWSHCINQRYVVPRASETAL
jgi:hypothetical protein